MIIAEWNIGIFSFVFRAKRSLLTNFLQIIILLKFSTICKLSLLFNWCVFPWDTKITEDGDQGEEIS